MSKRETEKKITSSTTLGINLRLAKLRYESGLSEGNFEYSLAAEPPVLCGESHLSRLAKPPINY